MSDILQAPTNFNLTMVSGNPFVLTIQATFVNYDNVAIPWSDIVNPVLTITGGQTPTCLSSEGQWEFYWTAAQTAEMEGPALTWEFSCEIVQGGVTPVWGPYTLLTGTITVNDPSVSGTASTVAPALTVSVFGIAVATLTIF
jgi:hypothetical protein